MAKVLALGEIMLRLSVGDGVRLADAQAFTGDYGGAEANVAISLANFGHKVSFASKVPENPLGEGAIAHLRRHGVDTSLVLRGGARLGTYYLEMGVGPRGSQATYDRAGSSFAAMETCEWNLDELLTGVDLLHITGICPAVSLPWRGLACELVHAAHERGCAVSFDVNYRAKLWGWDECMKTLREIMPYVDIFTGGIWDVEGILGLSRTDWSEAELAHCYCALMERYPRIRAAYSTRREAPSSSANELTGYLMVRGEGLAKSATYRIEPIVDRVGGGDAFASGVLHGLLSGWDAERTVEFGVAASVLKHTVAGDCNRFSGAEVEAFMASGADVAR